MGAKRRRTSGKGGTLIHRRTFLKGAAAAGGAAAIGGIPRMLTAAQAPAAPKGISLRVMAYPFPVTQMIRDGRTEYEKQTGIKIEWEEAPWNEALSKQMAELVAKTGRYDLFTIEGMWVGQEAGTGQLLELDDLVAKAGTALDWQDFVPKRRELFVYKGKVIGLPLETNITMAAYRKDVFEQEGIKLPAKGSGYTHEEWLSIVKRLHKGGQIGTAWPLKPMMTAVQHWGNALVSAGGRFFDEKLNPTFNSKESLRVAEFFRELLAYAPKDMLSYTNVEANEGMMSGKVATQTSHWASRIPMVEDKTKSKVAGKVRWTLLPYGGFAPGRKVGMAHNNGWCLGIPKGSKHQREAFDFAVWAVSKENQNKLLGSFLTPPTRLSSLNAPGLDEKYVWLPAVKEALVNSFDFPKIPEWAEIMERVGAELHGSWAGQTPLPKALDRANQLVADLMKERGYPVGTWKGAKLPWEG